MLLRNFGATCYYETLVQHVTPKLWCNMLLRNSSATCYYKTSGYHVTTEFRCNMLLRNSGAKGFSEISVPTYWSTAQCRKIENKNINLTLREKPHILLVYTAYLKYCQDSCKCTETRTFCAQYGELLVPEFATTVSFSARNEYLGKRSIQNHEECTTKKCKLHENSLYTVHTICLPASQDSSQHCNCWKPYVVV